MKVPRQECNNQDKNLILTMLLSFRHRERFE